MGNRDLADLRRRRLLARDALERAGTVAFKPVSSAKWVDVEVSRYGGIRVQIEHDTIRGVTPEMMRWWFENLPGHHDLRPPQQPHFVGHE